MPSPEEPTRKPKGKFITSGLRFCHNNLASVEGLVNVLPLMVRSWDRIQMVDLSFNHLTRVPDELFVLPLVALHLHSNSLTYACGPGPYSMPSACV